MNCMKVISTGLSWLVVIICKIISNFKSTEYSKLGEIIMQNEPLIVHNCVIFWKQHQYLYGLTSTFLMSSRANKLQPYFLIIPSQAYKNEIYQYFGLQELMLESSARNCDSRLKSDRVSGTINHLLDNLLGFVVKDRIFQERILKKYEIPLVSVVIQTYDQHDIDQEYLLNVQKRHLDQLYPLSKKHEGKELLGIQMAKWLNEPHHQLKIMLSESGYTTYLCRRTEIAVINPTEQFVCFLKQPVASIQLPLPEPLHTQQSLYQLLHTVVVANFYSIYAVLGLLLLPFKNPSKIIRVIVTSPVLETLIYRYAYSELRFKQSIVQQRLWIRVLQPLRKYPFLNPTLIRSSNRLNANCRDTPAGVLPLVTNKTHLNIEFDPGELNSCPTLQIYMNCLANDAVDKNIMFLGMTPLSFLCMPRLCFPLAQQQQHLCLRQFPTIIQKIDHLVLYQMSDRLLAKLKTLPFVFRKKIIYNRLEHKFHHKYFQTLGSSTSTTSNVQIPGSQLQSIYTDDQSSQNCFKNGLLLISENDTQMHNPLLQLSEGVYNYGDYLTVANEIMKPTAMKQYGFSSPRKCAKKLEVNHLFVGLLNYRVQTARASDIQGQKSRVRVLNKKWKLFLMSFRSQINTIKSVVFVVEGLVLHLRQEVRTGPFTAVFLKQGDMSINQHDYDFSIAVSIKQSVVAIQPFKQYTLSYHLNSQQTLKQVCIQAQFDAEMIKSMHRSIPSVLDKLNDSFFHSLSVLQKQILMLLGRQQRYEISTQISQSNHRALRTLNQDSIASVGCLIGALASTSQSQQCNITQSIDCLVALQDTLLVKYDTEQFYSHFGKLFPMRLHQLLSMGITVI